MFKKKKKSNLIKLVDNSGNSAKSRDSAAETTKNTVANVDNSTASTGTLKKKARKPTLANVEDNKPKSLTTEKVLNLTEISLSDGEETPVPALSEPKAFSKRHGKQAFLPAIEKEEQNAETTSMPEFDENVFASLKGFDYLNELENETKDKLRNLTNSN